MAAVVNHEHAIIDPPQVEIRRQALERRGQPLFLVEGGDNDRQIVIGLARLPREVFLRGRWERRETRRLELWPEARGCTRKISRLTTETVCWILPAPAPLGRDIHVCEPIPLEYLRLTFDNLPFE